VRGEVLDQKIEFRAGLKIRQQFSTRADTERKGDGSIPPYALTPLENLRSSQNEQSHKPAQDAGCGARCFQILRAASCASRFLPSRSALTIYKRSTHCAAILYECKHCGDLTYQYSAVYMFRLSYLWRLRAGSEQQRG